MGVIAGRYLLCYTNYILHHGSSSVPELCNLAKTITHAGIDAYRTAVWASGTNNHYNFIDTHYVIIQISSIPQIYH